MLVFGQFPEWMDERAVGDMRVLAPHEAADVPPDVVVASGREARDALRAGAEMAIIECPSFVRGRGGALEWRRLLALPSAEAPAFYVPLDHPAALRYVLRALAPPRRWLRIFPAASRRIARHAARAFPSRVVATACRNPGPPFVLAAARELGVPAESQWFLMAASGDPRDKRAVFQVFPAGAAAPTTVLKVAHFDSQRAPFDDQERGLAAAVSAGSAVSARAPRPIGRFEAQGLPASAEEAAVGQRLGTALVSTRSREKKLELVERVYAWLVEAARASTAGAERLERQRKRLANRVLPEWLAYGAPTDLVDRIASTRATFEHNDLSPQNVVMGPSGLMVVDWENARLHGFPLRDLWFFLALTLPIVDGWPDGATQRLEHFAALFRGELPSSRVVFTWTRRLVELVGVPAEAVGPLATLCWLDYGIPEWVVPRELEAPLPSWLRDWTTGRSVVDTLLGTGRLKTMMAQRWLSDGALGATWSRWQQ